jgi:hypothetical protein
MPLPPYQQINDKAPRMLLVDMLFWKDHSAAAAINQDYWLWVGAAAEGA